MVDEQKGNENGDDATNGGKGQQYWNVLINNYSTNSTCQHIERMQAGALNHLLDMKQKQANLGEARSARKQAADTARQGNFILAFTVFTVIFTPLSFAAAYLAIPDNSGTSRTARILGIAESATLAVVIPVLVYLTWSDHIGAKNLNKVKT
ncbi:hypothetical protein OIDMADRAFT_58539 [Oidiodendron maius Zn]|uniref:Uncharacterized protein n=1 Tax=Oidiodendron maius (strain Zn) TaxID=913774 RepID=A0A0C3CDG8_OIDMZ|nr:hypothetical protein OIDMADRAFT_58539 [Oidiodendron maius Zn]